MTDMVWKIFQAADGDRYKLSPCRKGFKHKEEAVRYAISLMEAPESKVSTDEMIVSIRYQFEGVHLIESGRFTGELFVLPVKAGKIVHGARLGLAKNLDCISGINRDETVIRRWIG